MALEDQAQSPLHELCEQEGRPFVDRQALRLFGELREPIPDFDSWHVPNRLAGADVMPASLGHPWWFPRVTREETFLFLLTSL